jgi:hypothetical protein
MFNSSIEYSNKLYNIALDLIDKNDPLNSQLFKKDTLNVGISPIREVIELNHQDFLMKVNDLLSSKNESYTQMD